MRDGGLERGAEPDPGLGVEDEDGVPGVAGPVSALEHPKLSSNKHGVNLVLIMSIFIQQTLLIVQIFFQLSLTSCVDFFSS